MVAAAYGADEAFSRDAAQDRDGQFGTDTRDGQQFFKQPLLGELLKAEQKQGIFPHVGVDVQCGGCSRVAELRVRGNRDRELITHATTFKHDGTGRFREDQSAKMGYHFGHLTRRGRLPDEPPCQPRVPTWS